MNRWLDKVAVVTGASSGIGAAIAEKLVEHGLKVVGIARRSERVEELAGKLKQPGKLYALKTDMSKEDEIVGAFKWIKDNVGPVSVLVNNAGIAKKTTIVNGNISDWKDIFDTNVLGLAIASKLAIASMQENDIDGHIVNINSVLGHTLPYLPFINVYPASKFAVTAFTETLRQELVGAGSKIKVTSLSPGYVKTEIFEVGGFRDNSEIVQMLDTLPGLNPEDIADSVVHILSSPPHVQITELTVRPVGERSN